MRTDKNTKTNKLYTRTAQRLSKIYQSITKCDTRH